MALDERSVDRLAVGAVGRPGERLFLIEVEADGERSWFHVEKAQVAALAAQSLQLLREAGFEHAGGGIDASLTDPGEIRFRVREVRLIYREDPGLVHVTLSPGEGEADHEVSFTVTPAQLDAMAREGQDAVGAGRPKCRRCGLAMDPEGHPCPIGNGDLRGHRP